MELTDDQKKALTQWITAGATLSEVQKRLTDEFKVSVTYMDLRLTLIDLGLEAKEKPARPAAPSMPPSLAAPGAPPPKKEKGRGLFGALGREEPAPAGVSVEVDRLTPPGALVSGAVTFSDGVKAKWALDQTGRLALDAGRAGYRPSEADVKSFQEALARELEKRGF